MTNEMFSDRAVVHHNDAPPPQVYKAHRSLLYVALMLVQLKDP